MQWKRRGDPEAPRLKGRAWTPDELRLLDDYLAVIPLRRAKAEDHELERLTADLGRTRWATNRKLCQMRQERRAQIAPAPVPWWRRILRSSPLALWDWMRGETGRNSTISIEIN